MGEPKPCEVIVAKTATEFAEAGKLFREYAAALDFDLCFQGFEQELNELPRQYGFPNGGLILLQKGKQFVGCAGIRRFENRIGELKRMYIQPDHRGQGFGHLLLESTIRHAVELGYDFLRLDTLKSMSSAIKLYRHFDFYDIPAYRYNPSEEVLYFEKVLSSKSLSPLHG